MHGPLRDTIAALLKHISSGLDAQTAICYTGADTGQPRQGSTITVEGFVDTQAVGNL